MLEKSKTYSHQSTSQCDALPSYPVPEGAVARQQQSWWRQCGTCNRLVGEVQEIQPTDIEPVSYVANMAWAWKCSHDPAVLKLVVAGRGPAAGWWEKGKELYSQQSVYPSHILPLCPGHASAVLVLQC